ncbi:MAG: excinuclease ABC subunit UvrC [Ruminococcaceae bacterium]|nr:excinuclease ABC subunit UvrC [Oscillospiraceae bacterium]
MNEKEQRLRSLREKAAALPLRPGVYLMKNSDGKVIYVGKSKALRNRVSSYFQGIERHNLKTLRMVMSVKDFDWMPTDSEIEALALENKLIKLYQPKYNIRLKDGKSYPYIRMPIKEAYPKIYVTRERKEDGARYFGPYSGISVAYEIVDSVKRIFGIPGCKYRFPQEIGKIRPCLYSQIGQCVAPCTGNVSTEEYALLMEDVTEFLRGNYRKTAAVLQERMTFAAENLRFELAARYRDRLKALERLQDKQKVVGAPGARYDAVSLYQGDLCSCLCLGYIRDGVLIDREYHVFGADQILEEEDLMDFLCRLYQRHTDIPPQICLGFGVCAENGALFSEYLVSLGVHTEIHEPKRGDKKAICELMHESAKEHAAEYIRQNEKGNTALATLSCLLGLASVPETIESVDISNLGNEQITAGLIRFTDGKPDKSGYRTFKFPEMAGQDDYYAMAECIRRRLRHKESWPLPDLLLLDGGKGHVTAVKAVLQEEGVILPVFGMVKDEYHKTRCITDGTGEISIAGEQSVFSLIYRIQEEVHRYTVGRMMQGKRKTLSRSILCDVPGVGEKKAALILKTFGGLAGVKQASVEEIASVKGINREIAETIVRFLKEKKK